MSSIPSHYSERYVNQRYNKALHIVQHLPASSSFQPNKDEKLQLYSLYKQVSHGDIDTQRPGIFDVVGRAKWDAWKKLKGLSSLEAKHRYVDTLLKICAEAYKKPAAKAQVQQIIQAFATIRPMDDDDSDDTEDSDDSNDEDGHDDGETSESLDEEEQAYLMDIQQSVPAMTPSKSASTMGSQASDSYHSLRSPVLRSSTSTRTKQSNRLSWHGKQPRQLRRAPSIDSTQSMVTAPNAPTRRLSRSSSITTNFNNAAGMRPPSTMSQRSDVNQQSQHYSRTRRTNLPHANLATQEPTALGVHTSANTREPLFDEDHLDNSVNPWATTQDTGGGSSVIPNRRYRMGDDSSDDSIDEEYKQNYLYARPPTHNLTSAAPSSGATPSTTAGGMMTGIGSSSSVTSHYYQQPNGLQQQHQHQQQQMNQFDLPMQSPLLGGSTTSSVTATGAFSDSQRQNQHHRQQQPLHTRENRLSTDQQYTSIVALGPATKRALEILQAEILALNERIDGLRQELIDRDQKDLQNKKKKSILSGRNLSQRGDDDEIWDAWGWVFKAALKHTTVNLITIFVIVLLLYKRGNPIADVIIGSLYKQWHKLKLGLIKNNRMA
ncbi:unnamed protein product [Absidia cylindrospora]